MMSLFHSVFFAGMILTCIFAFVQNFDKVQPNSLEKRSSLTHLLFFFFGMTLLFFFTVFFFLFIYNVGAVTLTLEFFVGSLLTYFLAICCGLCLWHLREGMFPSFTNFSNMEAIGGGLILFAVSMILSLVWPGADKLTTTPGLQQISQSIPALVAMLFVVINAAIAEELIFRLGMQTLLQQALGLWPAILITSTIFMFGHMGMVEPLGFKETQIFLVSVVFGMLRQRHGIFASIIAHGVFNVSAIIAQLLILLIGWDPTSV